MPIEILILAVVALLIFWFKSRIVVPPDKQYIVARFGRLLPVLKPGTHFLVPFVDVVQIRYSTREIRVSVPEFVEVNLQNMPLTFSSELRYEIQDAILLRESVANRAEALRKLCQTCVKEVVVDYDLDTILAEKQRFEDQVARRAQDLAKAWGVKITGFEAKMISPPDEVLIALEKKAKLDRESRGTEK